MQTFPDHWDLKTKVEYLQRKVILNCIAYYELDWSPLDDFYYKEICEQLLNMQNEYGDISDTQYGYVMHDFDVSTGFDLYYRLTKEDQEHLMRIAEDAFTRDSKVVSDIDTDDDEEEDKIPFLFEHQKEAVKKMRNGCILNGGVGTGKSRTGLYYYFKEQGGSMIPEHIPMNNPKDLYIITTAKKRDDLDWEKEMIPFFMSTNPKLNLPYTNKIAVDSWNNIGKYSDVRGAFFIFDEQRVVGSGAWVKSFLKIAKTNDWILLSATAGDTWSDYIPVFVANGFYRNRTEFHNEHVVWSRFTKYPKIDRYLNTGRLIRLRNRILVDMDFKKHTNPHHEDIIVKYDISKYKDVGRDRWNPYTNKPIKNAAELCYTWRKIVNSDESRQLALLEIFEKHPKLIIFYNFDYELDILRELFGAAGVEIAEWNGHKHQPVPNSDSWVYLVNYTAGCEGWNCITTDTIVFYSQTYSYKVLTQACGRIDRLNTPFIDLYYYHLKSRSGIDLGITKALKNKRNFNENRYITRTTSIDFDKTA